MAVYTVSQVTSYLREALESDPLLGDLNVAGEISNLRVSGAGHSYFTLKDQQNILNSVMFRGQHGADLLANGVSISAHGRITFYEPRGSTDFMVDLVMAEGAGEFEAHRQATRVEVPEVPGRLPRLSRRAGLEIEPQQLPPQHQDIPISEPPHAREDSASVTDQRLRSFHNRRPRGAGCAPRFGCLSGLETADEIQ